MYYALADLQVGRYLQTGINSTNKQELLKDFIRYVSIDRDNTELEYIDEKKYLPLANGDYIEALCMYYYDTYKNKPEEFWDIREFELEEQEEKFIEED